MWIGFRSAVLIASVVVPALCQPTLLSPPVCSQFRIPHPVTCSSSVPSRFNHAHDPVLLTAPFGRLPVEESRTHELIFASEKPPPGPFQGSDQRFRLQRRRPCALGKSPRLKHFARYISTLGCDENSVTANVSGNLVR